MSSEHRAEKPAAGRHYAFLARWLQTLDEKANATHEIMNIACFKYLELSMQCFMLISLPEYPSQLSPEFKEVMLPENVQPLYHICPRDSRDLGKVLHAFSQRAETIHYRFDRLRRKYGTYGYHLNSNL